MVCRDGIMHHLPSFKKISKSKECRYGCVCNRLLLYIFLYLQYIYNSIFLVKSQSKRRDLSSLYKLKIDYRFKYGYCIRLHMMFSGRRGWHRVTHIDFSSFAVDGMMPPRGMAMITHLFIGFFQIHSWKGHGSLSRGYNWKYAGWEKNRCIWNGL